MALLITGLALFFGPHFYSAFRRRSAENDISLRMGENTFKGIYSLISLIGLALIILGYWQAPPTGNIYIGPDWARHAAMTLMLLSFISLAAAYVPQTHLKKWLKHPMVIAILLWSAAHLLIGANLQKLLLFGSFLLFSIVDLAAVSLRAAPSEGAAPTRISRDLICISLGAAAFFGTVYWAHELLFGVSPILY